MLLEKCWTADCFFKLHIKQQAVCGQTLYLALYGNNLVSVVILVRPWYSRYEETLQIYSGLMAAMLLVLASVSPSHALSRLFSLFPFPSSVSNHSTSVNVPSYWIHPSFSGGILWNALARRSPVNLLRGSRNTVSQSGLILFYLTCVPVSLAIDSWWWTELQPPQGTL